MHFLLLFQIVFEALFVESNTKRTYFSIDKKVVYSNKFIKAVPSISVVQCLLLCKQHKNCRNVVMNADKQCLLLIDDVCHNSSLEAVVNTTRLSQVDDIGTISANSTKGNVKYY